ncbi:MAG: hypothetical protein H7Y37_11355 [Anaerolineae bacterium]|nr:hypothetical protein [Gloeobacterales cyanobacterium ES-bin-313]
MRMQTLGTVFSVVVILLLLGTVVTGITAKGSSSGLHAGFSGTVAMLAIAAIGINIWQIRNLQDP